MTSTPPDQIECLILDLFGVIVAFDDGLVYDRIAQRCTKAHEAAELMSNLVSDHNLIRGFTPLQQLYAKLVAEVGLSTSIQEFESMWLASYSEPMPGIRDLLRQVAGQCRLVLLSNVDPYYWPTVHASIPELQYFHAKVLSFEHGVAKPDAQTFERAVTASGVAIERCYFVDDKAENVEAASAIGLAGHVFQNCRMLKTALRRAGLHVE